MSSPPVRAKPRPKPRHWIAPVRRSAWPRARRGVPRKDCRRDRAPRPLPRALPAATAPEPRLLRGVGRGGGPVDPVAVQRAAAAENAVVAHIGQGHRTQIEVNLV